MRFLLDTNVLSEPMRPNPDPRVVAWLRAQPALDFAISVLSLGEIQRGVTMMAPRPGKASLERWISTELPRQFSGRVLAVDEPVAREWGRLSAEGRRRGRDLPAIDGLILATAAVHGLILVTRNVADCADRGVPVLDPWSAQSSA